MTGIVRIISLFRLLPDFKISDSFEEEDQELLTFYSTQLINILAEEKDNEKIKALSSISNIIIEDIIERKPANEKQAQDNGQLRDLLTELGDMIKSEGANKLSIVRVVQNTEFVYLLWILHTLEQSNYCISIATSLIELPHMIDSLREVSQLLRLTLLCSLDTEINGKLYCLAHR